MNWKHLAALIQLRYQLSINQIKKAGKANVIISMIAIAIVGLGSVAAFFVGLIGGAFWFHEASNTVLLVTWNLILAGFLFVWCIGLLVELQQTELMSLNKLLHLPLTLREAFILNYASSFLNASCLMFMPGMVGVSLGMILARGLSMSLSIVLLFGFIFFITALTYQFRGWLESLMENKRRRSTVIALSTVAFIAVAQTPHLFNMRMDSWMDAQEAERKARSHAAIEAGIEEIAFWEEIARATGQQEGRIPNGILIENLVEETARQEALEVAEAKKLRRQLMVANLRIADAYFPPGWLPLGIVNMAEGRFWPALCATLGFAVTGFVSLCLAYRSSVRRYTGASHNAGFWARSKSRKASPAQASNFGTSGLSKKAYRARESMFRKLPYCSEAVSGIAVSGARGLMRSPEAKMTLILPFILVVLFGAIFLSRSTVNIPQSLLPLVPLAVIAFGMFAISGIIFNAFGMDRDGFRALVLAPVSRRDILLGKNLSLAPLAMGLPLIQLAILQWFIPQTLFGLLAAVLQTLAIYLVYCTLGNIASIFTPIGLKRGTAQPVNTKFIPMMIMLLAVTIGPSVCLIPTSFACGIPMIIEYWKGWSMDWLYLLLTLGQLAATATVYLTVLQHQGDWLWNRETKILEQVANVPE